MSSNIDKYIEEAQPSPFKVDEHVQTLITWLSHKISMNASITLRRRFDIGTTDWRVMAILGIYGPSSGSRICEIVGLDKSGVSRSFTTLEGRGLVKLEKTGAAGRTATARLTREGKSIFNRATALSMAREKILLAGISPKDQKKLFASMQIILRNIDNLTLIDEIHF